MVPPNDAGTEVWQKDVSAMRKVLAGRYSGLRLNSLRGQPLLSSLQYLDRPGTCPTQYWPGATLATVDTLSSVSAFHAAAPMKG